MSNRWRRQYEGLEGLMGKMWCASRYFVYTLEKTFFSLLGNTLSQIEPLQHSARDASDLATVRIVWKGRWLQKGRLVIRFQNAVRMGMAFVPQEVKLQHFCVNLHSILKYLSDNNSIFPSFVLVSFKPYVQSAWDCICKSKLIFSHFG